MFLQIETWLVVSAPFSLSGRLYEPEATRHFKKAHRLFEDGENRRVFQRSLNKTFKELLEVQMLFK
jgi:hypothetical protein